MRAKEGNCWIGELSYDLRVPKISWLYSHCIEESPPVSKPVEVDKEKPELDGVVGVSEVEIANPTVPCNGTSG